MKIGRAVLCYSEVRVHRTLHIFIPAYTQLVSHNKLLGREQVFWADKVENRHHHVDEIVGIRTFRDQKNTSEEMAQTLDEDQGLCCAKWKWGKCGKCRKSIRSTKKSQPSADSGPTLHPSMYSWCWSTGSSEVHSQSGHLPGHFILHASFCWQAFCRVWFHFPAGLGSHWQSYQTWFNDHGGTNWPYCNVIQCGGLNLDLLHFQTLYVHFFITTLRCLNIDPKRKENDQHLYKPNHNLPCPCLFLSIKPFNYGTENQSVGGLSFVTTGPLKLLPALSHQ